MCIVLNCFTCAQASIQLLGAMSSCAPQQLATSLPTVVPALAGVLGDAHPKARPLKTISVVLCR
jgi:hypothetical protein